jgi:hypothetical protein
MGDNNSIVIVSPISFDAFAETCKWNDVQKNWVACKVQPIFEGQSYEYCEEKKCALFSLYRDLRELLANS